MPNESEMLTETGGQKIIKDVWDWLENGKATLDSREALLNQQVDYFLRKWAALEIYNAEAPLDLSPSESRFIRVPHESPIEYAEKSKLQGDGKEGSEADEFIPGVEQWWILEDENSLKTSRPNLFSDYAALGYFMNAIDHMIETAGKKGWNQIGFYGFGVDYAWVSVEQYNLSRGGRYLSIVNYEPGEKVMERYVHLLKIGQPPVYGPS